MSLSKKSEKSPFMSILFGILIQLMLLILLIVLSSVVAYLTENPLGLIKPISLFLMPISAFISALILKSKGMGLGVGMLISLAFVLILFIMSVIASGGDMLGALLGYLSYLLSSGIALILPRRERKRGKRRH